MRTETTAILAPRAPRRGGPWAACALLLPLALALLGFTAVATKTEPALYAVMAIGLGMAALVVSREFFVVLLVSAVIAQNLMIALIATLLAAESIKVLQATNFLLCLGGMLVLTLRYFWQGVDLRRDVGRFTFAAIGLLAILVAYTGYGFRQGGATDAVIYLRNFSMPLMLLLIGFHVGGEVEPVEAIWRVSLVALGLGVLELVLRPQWYDYTGTTTFMAAKFSDFKQQFNSAADIMDYLNVSFLNLPAMGNLGFHTWRLLGPNMHPISFGYTVGLLALLAVLRRNYVVAGVAGLILMVDGSKGSIVMLAFALLASAAARWTGSVRATLAIVMGGLCCMLLGAFAYGTAIGDYHIIGFLGGVGGIVSAPTGHGLGVGGNLSSDFHDVAWADAQRYGLAVAVESAVGVAIYQLGVAAVLWLGFWLALGGRLIARGIWSRRPTLVALGGATLAMICNGVLQEEAMFAPAALGVCSLMAGAMLARKAAVAP